MEREAHRDLSASVPGSVPGCLCLRARAGWAQHALSQPYASPRAWHGRSHTPSPHTSGLTGGPATAWHGSVRGSGTPGSSGDSGFILYPAPAGFCSPSPLAGWLCSPAPRHVPTASARASPCPTDTWFIPGSAALAGGVPAGTGDVRGRGGPVLSGGVGAAGGMAAGPAPGGDGGDIPTVGLPW